jgi:hypothetical protein
MRLLTLFRAYVKARDEYEKTDEALVEAHNTARFDQLADRWYRRRRQMVKFGARLGKRLAMIDREESDEQGA